MGHRYAGLDIDGLAVAHVIEREQAAGRDAFALPQGTTVGVVANPPRIVEVCAFEGAADSLDLEGEVLDAALSDPNVWLYVVEHVGTEDITVTEIGGAALRALLETRVEYRWAEVAWPGADAVASLAKVAPEVEAVPEADAAEEMEGEIVARVAVRAPEPNENPELPAPPVFRFVEDVAEPAAEAEHETELAETETESDAAEGEWAETREVLTLGTEVEVREEIAAPAAFVALWGAGEIIEAAQAGTLLDAVDEAEPVATEPVELTLVRDDSQDVAVDHSHDVHREPAAGRAFTTAFAFAATGTEELAPEPAEQQPRRSRWFF